MSERVLILTEGRSFLQEGWLRGLSTWALTTPVQFGIEATLAIIQVATKQCFTNCCSSVKVSLFGRRCTTHRFTATNIFVPHSLWGAALSPFLIPAPHCRGLSWLIDISSASVQGVWMSAGVVLSAGLVQWLPGVDIAQAVGNRLG